MTFDRVFYESVKKYLKRIRIKVDPSFASSENYEYINGYEGFILEEDTKNIKLLVIKKGLPEVIIPKKLLTYKSIHEIY